MKPDFTDHDTSSKGEGQQEKVSEKTSESDSVYAQCLPLSQRVEEWLQKFRGLRWCAEDDCRCEEATLDALKIARSLNLSVHTAVRSVRVGGLYQHLKVGQEVVSKLRKCRYSDQDDHSRWLDDAVKESGVTTSDVGCAVPRNRRNPELWYDNQTTKWWTPEHDGRYHIINRDMAVGILSRAGLSRRVELDGTVSEVEQHLQEVCHSRSFDAAVSLAGYRPGLHLFSGKRVLVTDSFTLVKPAEGDYPCIRQILNGLLGDQAVYLLAWMKIFYEALRDDRDQSGQMAIFCGPPACGKTFLIDKIITPVFGHRQSLPGRYFTGKTEFNSELFGAEHLVLDDAKPYSNFLSRNDFTEHLKGIIAGKTQSFHAKGRNALMLRPRWRISMALNDDAESLRCLPTLSDSFADKVHLFSCSPFEWPMPNVTAAEQQEFMQTIQRELPHLVYSLVNCTVPPEIVDVRFGMRHYHDPSLLEAITEMSDEEQLHGLVNSVLNRTQPLNESGIHEWVGPASELQELIENDRSVGTRARKLLDWKGACSSLLGKLAKCYPDMYESERQGPTRRRVWKISLPRDESFPEREA